MPERKTHHAGMIFARLIWLMIALLALGLWAGGLSARYQELLIPCSESACPPLSLASGEIDLLSETGF